MWYQGYFIYKLWTVFIFYLQIVQGIHDKDLWKINNHKNWKIADRDKCGETLADRIIGGTNASLGQYPWLAQVGYSNMRGQRGNIMFGCGGALITSCWILTAAHCITDLPSNIFVSGVRLGEHDTKNNIDCDSEECAEPTQDFAPSRILMHKYYGKPKFRNDIALIKLNKPAQITRWVTPICLPFDTLLTKNLNGQKAEVAGWGVMNVDTGKKSQILQTVSLPVVSLARCQNSYKKNVNLSEEQMCVGGIKGFDSCGGDSGGPLMKVDAITTPKYFVFGIVSFGSKFCGKKTTPAVYTNLAKYMKWILDNISGC